MAVCLPIILMLTFGAIEAAKGRRILFIDTCHSGNAYNQRLGNAAYHANIVAYTAARFDQEARHS